MAKESPTLPPTSAAQRWALTLLYAGMSAVAVYYLRLGPTPKAADKHFEGVMAGGDWRWADHDTVLRRHYTGIAPLDFGLSFLVAAFFYGTAGWVKGIQLQQGYFLLQFFPVIVAWSVESFRARNGWALITFTSLWPLLYQTVGGAIIIPLFYLCYTWTAARTDYWAKGRELPLARARTLLPAVVLGYLVPTLATWLPLDDLFDLYTRQAMVAFWQVTPLVVNLLWLLFSSLASETHSTTKTRSASADIRALSPLYLVSLLVAQASHAAILFLCSTSPTSDPSISFSFIFGLRPPVDPLMHEAIHFIFKVDYWIIAAASVLWCVQAEWELIGLRRTDLTYGAALLGTLAGAVVFGPGTVLSAVWWWRESKIGAVATAKKAA